jgi:hypothetical protein
MLIDVAFGEFGQLLVGLLFLSQSGIEAARSTRLGRVLAPMS